jgi:hypothetical protein
LPVDCARLGFIKFRTTRSLTVPTEPGVRVAASPWAWDRRQPLGRGILVTASRSALWVLASRWAEEAHPLGDTGNRSLPEGFAEGDVVFPGPVP